MIIFWYKNGHGFYWFRKGADLNPDCQMNKVYDYQSMKSGTDPPSGIPRHEGLINSVGSPILTDFLKQDGTEEKEVNICHYDLSFFPLL